MKRLRRTTAIIVVLLAVIIAGGLYTIKQQAAAALKNLTYETIDMQTLMDGQYLGEADAGLVKARVQVTIKDHAIIQIDILEHKNGMGQKAERIVKDMVKDNTCQVDVISGATLSSLTIKSAVSRALKQGELQ